MTELIPALFGQEGRICTVLGKRSIYALVEGPIFVSFGQDLLPELKRNYKNNLIKFSSFVIYEDGKPRPCEKFKEGDLVLFDAFKIKNIGYVATVVWTDSKPTCIPLPDGDSFIVCEVLKDVPVVHIKGSLHFVHENMLKQASIELKENVCRLLKSYKARKFKGIIYVFSQQTRGQPLRYVCTSLSLTETISYSPRVAYNPYKLYKVTENGVEMESDGCYLNSNVPGVMIRKDESYWLNFTFKSKDFNLPVSPNILGMPFKCEVLLYILEHGDNLLQGCRLLEVGIPGMHSAFSVDIRFDRDSDNPCEDQKGQSDSSLVCGDINVHDTSSSSESYHTCDEEDPSHISRNADLDEPSNPPKFNQMSPSVDSSLRPKSVPHATKHYLNKLDQSCIVSEVDSVETEISEQAYPKPAIYVNHSPFKFPLGEKSSLHVESPKGIQYPVFPQRKLRRPFKSNIAVPVTPEFHQTNLKKTFYEVLDSISSNNTDSSETGNESSPCICTKKKDSFKVNECVNNNHTNNVCIVSEPHKQHDHKGQQKGLTVEKGKELVKKNNTKFENFELGDLLDFLGDYDSLEILSTLSVKELKHFQFPNLIKCSMIEASMWEEVEELEKTLSLCKNNYLRNWPGVVKINNKAITLTFSVKNMTYVVDVRECYVIIDNTVVLASKAFKVQWKNVTFDAYRLAYRGSYHVIIMWLGEKTNYIEPVRSKDGSPKEIMLFDAFGIISKIENNFFEITCRYPIKGTLFDVNSYIYNGFCLSRKLHKDQLGTLVLLNVTVKKAKMEIPFIVHLTNRIRASMF